MAKYLILAALLAVAFDPTEAHAKVTTKYDAEICKQSKRLFPARDCDWMKAQLIQESGLNPKAVSPVGAQGLGQIMPKTWMDICKPLLICHLSPFSPKPNIRASVYYQARSEAFWVSKRPAPDRMALGLAGYNAGNGNIQKAQKLCNMEVLYACIIPCLPQVTKHHAKETIGYVRSINKHYKKLKIGIL